MSVIEFVDTFKQPIECGSPIVYIPRKSTYLDMGYPVEFELTAAGLYRAHILNTGNHKEIIYGYVISGTQKVAFNNVFLFNNSVFNQQEADGILKKFGPPKMFFIDKSPRAIAPDLSYDDVVTKFIKKLSTMKIGKWSYNHTTSITTKDGKLTLKVYFYITIGGQLIKNRCTIQISNYYKNQNISKDTRLIQAFEKLIDDYLTSNP